MTPKEKLAILLVRLARKLHPESEAVLAWEFDHFFEWWTEEELNILRGQESKPLVFNMINPISPAETTSEPANPEHQSET